MGSWGPFAQDDDHILDSAVHEGDDVVEPAAESVILGVQLRGIGPISNCYVPLQSPVTVLYGMNGAGKSSVLQGVALGLSGSEYELRAPDEEVTVFWRDVASPPNFGNLRRFNWDPWGALARGASRWVEDLLGTYQSSQSLKARTIDFVTRQIRPLDLASTIDERGLSLIEFDELDEATDDMTAEELEDHLDELWTSRVGRARQLQAHIAMALLEPRDTTWLEPGSLSQLVRPIGAALREGHFAVQFKFGRRTTQLCMPDPAPDTNDLIEAIHREARQAIWPGVDPEAAKRIVMSDHADIEGPIVGNEDHESLRVWMRERHREASADVKRGSFHRGWRFAPYEFLDETTFANPLSSVAAVLGTDFVPLWARDCLFKAQKNPGTPPLWLLNESVGIPPQYSLLALQIAPLVDAAEDRSAPSWPFWMEALERLHEKGLFGDDFGSNAFLTESANGLSASTELIDLARALEDEANRLLAALLPSAPALCCEVTRLTKWGSEGPLTWTARQPGPPGGVPIELEDLSSAELRWANFAIRLTDILHVREVPEGVVVILDEPERALHRRAEHHLARALTELAKQKDIRFVIASHSPSFLNQRDVELLHVKRDNHTNTVVRPVSTDLRPRLEELGLAPADLLQLCRGILLVEGQHELTILSALLGDELKGLGIELLCMRGAKHLKAWDAQLMQRFTDVPFFVLVDNDSRERIADVWDRAKRSHTEGRPHLSIIDELRTGGAGSEGEFLRELCKNLISDAVAERLHLLALAKPDIPEYLPPAALAPSTGGKNWEQLRTEAGDKAKSSGDFKKWMTSTYGASYSDSTLQEAVASMDLVPAELVAILNDIDRVLSASRSPVKTSQL